jgi:hypothetical protein
VFASCLESEAPFPAFSQIQQVPVEPAEPGIDALFALADTFTSDAEEESVGIDLTDSLDQSQYFQGLRYFSSILTQHRLLAPPERFIQVPQRPPLA